MSLTQGKICSALSFGVILDETGGVEDYQIQVSLVKPTYRLTYEDVDEILQLGRAGRARVGGDRHLVKTAIELATVSGRNQHSHARIVNQSER